MKSYQFHGAAPYYTNSYLLITAQNNAIVIDPAAAVAEYQDVLAREGATLVAILCTHGHFDHVPGALALREASGAVLYCHAADTRGNVLFPLPFADKGFADGEEITIDELTFHVYATPGHSAGSVCLLCGELLFSGDTIFRGSIGRTDLEGSDPNAMLATLRKFIALGLPSETNILPGHEGFSTYGHELATNWHLQNGCQ